MNDLSEIEEFFANLKFRKQTFAGISQEDALKKIEKLSFMYQEAFKNQEIAYKSLIDDKNKEIEKLRDKLNDR